MNSNRKTKTIVVHCRGRLGNQLFQIAAGFWVAEKTGRKLIINLPTIRSGNNDSGDTLAGIADFSQYLAKRNRFQFFAWRVLLRAQKFLPGVNCLPTGFELSNHDSAFKFGSVLHLHGYFANCLFAVQSSFLSHEFRPCQESHWFQKLKLEAQTKAFVALHVRRGDYMLNSNHWGLLSTTYYKRALGQLPWNLRNAPIWVFSDEPHLAQELLQSVVGYDFHFINPSRDASSVENLLLLAMGSGHILANSTFGYWGALLSRATQFVAYPERNKHGRAFVANVPSDWIAVREDWI